MESKLKTMGNSKLMDKRILPEILVQSSKSGMMFVTDAHMERQFL